MEGIILHGGSVVACDGEGTRAPALGIRDGRVAAIGSLREVRHALGPGARLVDVEGATVLPGLVDTHPHLMHFGVLAEPLVDLSDAVDHADVVARIAAKAAERRERAASVSDRRTPRDSHGGRRACSGAT